MNIATTFLRELRAAHAITSLHLKGEYDVEGIAHKSGLRVREVKEWVILLRLRTHRAQRLPRSARRSNLTGQWYS